MRPRFRFAAKGGALRNESGSAEQVGQADVPLRGACVPQQAFDVALYPPQVGHGRQVEMGLPRALDALHHVAEGHSRNVAGRGEGHPAVVLAVAHLDEQSGGHELVEYVGDDSERQVQPLADLLRRGRPARMAEAAHDDRHGGEQDFAALVGAHVHRGALLLVARNVLIGEREVAAPEQDLPRGVEPQQQQGQGGEAAVDDVVGGHQPLEVEIAPLEEQKGRAGDDARLQSARQTHLGVGDHVVEEGEHAPCDGHRGHARQQQGAPSVVEAEELAGVAAQGAHDDPQQRHDHDDGDVGRELAQDAPLVFHLPDVVEGVLDRPADARYRDEEQHQGDGRHDPSLGTGQGVFGEGHQVVDDLGALREEAVEVLQQRIRAAESLHDGENHRGDRHQRGECVEGQGGASHEGVVLLQTAPGVEQQVALPGEPAAHGVAADEDAGDLLSETVEEGGGGHGGRGFRPGGRPTDRRPCG